ncbi:MAG: glycosyltransferase family 2 protein [Candidatus Melainabacteria bacterium]|nr:glycosyltransferase family 2 protein [Candidatus Melainabacteria bacterium]
MSSPADNPDLPQPVPSGAMGGRRRVGIILVNFRNPADTLKCLASLQGLHTPNTTIVVVDNGSHDGSASQIERCPYVFHLLESDTNFGFSGGNNLAIRFLLKQAVDYIWLLNNDTTVEADTLNHLLDEAERTGGLVGSLILNEDGTYQRAGTRINWVTGRSQDIPADDVQDGMNVECLCGASLLIPVPVLRRIDLLDESFFLYFEDSEYSLRAQKAGIACTLAAQSRVYHKEGATTGKTSLLTQYYYQRNRLLLLSQYADPVNHIGIGAYTLFRLLRSMMKACRSAEDKASFRVTLLAVKDFLQGRFGPCRHRL